VVQVDGLALAGHAAGTGLSGETRLAAIEPALQATGPADGLRLSLELFLDGLSRLRTRTAEG